MNIAIYKPNSKNTGCAFSFKIATNTKFPVFYVNAIMQHGWDDKKKTGSFLKNKDVDDKNVSFKLNEFELGEILSSIKSRIPWNSYHSFNDNTTVIKFAPWDKPRKIKTKDGDQTFQSPAFGLAVTRNGNQNYRIALEPGEVEALKLLIDTYFNCLFEARLKQESQAKSAQSEKQAPPRQEKSVNNNVDEDPPF